MCENCMVMEINLEIENEKDEIELKEEMFGLRIHPNLRTRGILERMSGMHGSHSPMIHW